MNLPPYSSYPEITGDKISLRQILNTDIEELIEISYYNSVQAESLEQAA